MKKELELYLHIPFCVKKCEYCDFLSGPFTKHQRELYIEALQKELRSAGERAEQDEVNSVFFGGGTPSLLTGEQMIRVMETLKQSFLVAKEAEISMEGNPGTFTEEKLRAYKKAGINRFSIGCQSVRERELKILGRIHTFAEFQKSYALAREAGFSNINVDLMSGLPGQTLEDWEENLHVIGDMHPEHISAYSLIVEEGTPFFEKELDLPGEETERLMYERTGEILREYGYEQYEISNYARPGKECRHNIGYWQRKNYLGFGLGAASLYDNVRFVNTSSMEKYLKQSSIIEAIRTEVQPLSVKEQIEEFMFLGLRMREGVRKSRFRECFDVSMEEIYGAVLEKYEKLGLLRQQGDKVDLTRAGIHVSNMIFTDFLLD